MQACSLPLVSVVVAARVAPEGAGPALASLAAQRRANDIEVILADGSDGGDAPALETAFPGARRVSIPGGNLAALKGAAIRAARGSLVAVLDPSDAAEPDWIDALLTTFDDPGVWAAGGTVLFAGNSAPGNVAAYLFEYGAFNPPVQAGDTAGDLPGNNVAYRREVLVDHCGDILAAEGFNKPFMHERIRALGGRLVVQPAMRVRHHTRYRFGPFAARRFHYGRCFGSVRVRRATPIRRALFRLSAPLVAPLLVVRHLRRAFAHDANRALLGGSVLALCGVCVCWGVGEWLGCWFGPGRSCAEWY